MQYHCFVVVIFLLTFFFLFFCRMTFSVQIQYLNYKMNTNGNKSPVNTNDNSGHSSAQCFTLQYSDQNNILRYSSRPWLSQQAMATKNITHTTVYDDDNSLKLKSRWYTIDNVIQGSVHLGSEHFSIHSRGKSCLKSLFLYFLIMLYVYFNKTFYLNIDLVIVN